MSFSSLNPSARSTQPASTAATASLSALGLVLSSTAAAWLGWGLTQDSTVLQAQSAPVGIDTDLDGLPDHQESVQSTDPASSDSDLDGFSDLEELARQSDPADAQSTPQGGSAEVGLTAFEAGDVVFVRTMVFVPSGDLSNLGLRFGFDYPARTKVDGQGAPIPPPELDINNLLAQSSFGTDLAADGSSLLISVITALPNDVLTEEAIFGPGLSFFAGLTSGAGQPITNAAAVSFSTGSGALHRLSSTPGGGTPGAGVIEVGQRPITIPGETPLSYTAEKICFQQAVLGGTVMGATAVYVVDESNCTTSSSFCRSDCASLVDSEIEVFDPLALIGG